MGLDTFVGHITTEEASGGQDEGLRVTETKKSDGIKKHISYKVVGKDASGDIEAWRRYKEFLKLRQALTERWPGFYCPPLPPKKAIGNLDQDFVEERRYFLDKFLKSLMQIPHLKESEEFQAFIRPKAADVERSLALLPKMTPETILERLKQTTGLTEDSKNDSEIKKCQDALKDFAIQSKKMFLLLE